jgi:hypothetical protein
MIMGKFDYSLSIKCGSNKFGELSDKLEHSTASEPHLMQMFVNSEMVVSS